MLAVGSLIALPPTLLLAFFGVTSPDVDPSRSILDLGRYWLAYGLAWLPFAALLLVGFLLRRRIRTSSGLVEMDHGGAEPVGRLVVAAPGAAVAGPGRPPPATGPAGGSRTMGRPAELAGRDLAGRDLAGPGGVTR